MQVRDLMFIAKILDEDKLFLGEVQLGEKGLLRRCAPRNDLHMIRFVFSCIAATPRGYKNSFNNPVALARGLMCPHMNSVGAKFNLEPVALDFSQGMKVNDLKIGEQFIIEHLDLIKTKWNEIHGF